MWQNRMNALTKRFVNVDLSGIQVRRALTESDFQTVARLREAGFSRISRNRTLNGRAAQWIDELDHHASVFCLIGYDPAGEPSATMRVQDGRISTLELARSVPLENLLVSQYQPAAQFGRLSVMKRPYSINVMFAIFKSAWRWCFLEKIESIVIATPPWSRHIYEFMFFNSLGAKGHFSHKYAGGALHVTMLLPVARAEDIWRAGRSPLCEQFLDITHPALELNRKEDVLGYGFARTSEASDC
jgi:hypothetical protein